jgi:hypothetical protein
MAHAPWKLYALAAHLLPEDASLVAEVRQAATDAEGYLRRFADQLEGRGVDEPIPELPWLALVDGLSARGRLEEIDWKEDADSIMEAIDGLLGKAAPRWEAFEEDAENVPTYEFLQRAGDLLLRSGTALAFLDIASDCYPLIVLPDDRLEAARQLAQEAGYGEVVPLRSTPRVDTLGY